MQTPLDQLQEAQKEETKVLAPSPQELSQSLGLSIRTVFAPTHVARTTYTPELAQEIIDFYASGYTFTQISRMEGMPSQAVIYAFRKEFPEFAKQIREARETRGIVFEEKILDIPENMDKDDVPSARLSFDRYAWAAEKNQPKEYGKQSTVSGGNTPIQITVNTGWAKPETREVESQAANAVPVPTVIEKINNELIESVEEDLT